MASVPGYPNLRYSGGALQPAEQHIAAATLERLQRAAQLLGGVTIDIFSGSGGPAVRHAGFAGDPHERGLAADASINGIPIGSYPNAVPILHRVGLRSGATDFTYQGRSDPAHVDYGVSAAGTGGGGAAAAGSPDTFWRDVLKQLGAPATKANIDSLKGWAAVEGTKAAYNPLATTLDEPGATQFNSVGVRNYPTPAIGAKATADTLKKGYPSIVASFRSGSGLQHLTSGLVNDLGKWVDGHSPADSKGIGYAQVVSQRANDPGASPAGFWHDPVISGTVDAAQTAADAALAVPRFLAKLTDPSYILRGLQIIAGAVLVLVGIVLLTRQVALAGDVPTSIPGGVRSAAGVD